MNDIRQEELVKDLKNIHDPDIEINIYDLGLIYNIQPTEENGCDVTMTLTSAFGPVADALVDEVRCATKKHYKGQVNINLTFEPQWSMENLSEEARLTLGYDV
jgi:metal-sulfur cluster biosynthetic enzyme